jgi:2-polyprenyl-3-methyl-5-hydroxy-6-metoxy-1,4-benzoquinol methylase
MMEEVHLWRGSAEQRALRFQLARSGQFAYFNQQLNYPDWSGKAVLDFGGNAGNLLLDPNSVIRPEEYYCVDVIREALQEGCKRFPQAHWIHYDRYNCSFNPDGVPDLPIPDMGIEFDMILAYSVFTHTTREEMNDLVEQLRAQLAPGGALAFNLQRKQPAMAIGTASRNASRYGCQWLVRTEHRRELVRSGGWHGFVYQQQWRLGHGSPGLHDL